MTLPSFITMIRWQDIVDITIISIVLYNILIWTKHRRAKQLFQGILVLLFLYAISHFFKFYTIAWLMQKLSILMLFVFIIVFQPELRQLLEKLGQSTELKYYLIQNKMSDELISIQFIQNLVRVIDYFSENKIGSLIVIEQLNNLENIKETGVLLNADFSNELLVNIFYGKSPLHDGAIIIKGSKIIAGGCLLPLTQTKLRDRSLGTRHKAALGLAELTDAIALVTSEETGIISIAKSGKLYRRLSRKKLQEQLLSYLQLEPTEGANSEIDNIFSIFKKQLNIFRKKK
ncbi:MAG: TIGR00159 family protein [Candidatus Margulisbacteria bacterium GWF2_35_9]|nr:MAG: TIGR00159 family protein [Candidatus Margulisbacteria bacterium GWF2_35_9]